MSNLNLTLPGAQKDTSGLNIQGNATGNNSFTGIKPLPVAGPNTTGLKIPGTTTTVPNPIAGGAPIVTTTPYIPVNQTPDASKVNNTTGITLPNNTSNVDNSLRATTDAAMATPPTPPASYDAKTGFLTPSGLSGGLKPVQPNDPAGGSNNNSAVNNYLNGDNPSNINNKNLIPDTSGNQNNTFISNYTGLNAQI